MEKFLRYSFCHHHHGELSRPTVNFGDWLRRRRKNKIKVLSLLPPPSSSHVVAPQTCTVETRQINQTKKFHRPNWINGHKRGKLKQFKVSMMLHIKFISWTNVISKFSWIFYSAKYFSRAFRRVFSITERFRCF